MNRLALISGAVLVILILSLSSNLMAQDPDDPGEPDTVYFAPGGMRSATGETLFVWPDSFPQDVVIQVNAWNDNDVAAVYVVLTDSCNAAPCSAELDPAKNNLNPFPKCFEGSRIDHFAVLVCKVTYYPPTFYFAGTAMGEGPLPPGNGLLAKFIFTVNDTGRICLDTTLHPPSIVTQFVTTGAEGYYPIFEKRTFLVSDCGYSSGDPNYDGNTDIVDIVYLVNYIFRSGPPPCFEKSGDVTCDDDVNVIDVVYLVSYLFKAGPPPGYCP